MAIEHSNYFIILSCFHYDYLAIEWKYPDSKSRIRLWLEWDRKYFVVRFNVFESFNSGQGVSKFKQYLAFYHPCICSQPKFGYNNFRFECFGGCSLFLHWFRFEFDYSDCLNYYFAARIILVDFGCPESYSVLTLLLFTFCLFAWYVDSQF